ncbi:hypothetical protein ACS0TY_006805 [Phlomoides rotata]
MEKAKKGRTERRRVGLLFDERMCKHKQAGGKHPENPERIRVIWDNLNAAGLLPRCVVLNAKESEDNHLALVHSKEHIDLIKTISSKNLKKMRKIANKYDSIYFNKGSSEAAYLAAGFVIEATEQVAKGDLDSAFAIVRPPGHHAEESEPMGFCLFNNVAIATSVILNERPELGIKKILIVDWDVHHGNSTQKMFYKDPRVLVFSVHRHDSGTFYPESDDGSYNMVGEGLGTGYNINVPWEGGGIGDADYFAVWDHILLPVAKEFDPDLIIISAGFDAAIGDPIGGCCLSPCGYSIMLYKLMGFARGKIVMALEGGYNPTSLANATQACIEMLLDYKPPNRSLKDLPLKPTWPLIKTVRQALCIYWPILAAEIPDKVINRRLHTEVDAKLRQEEVYDRTPAEFEHAWVSGSEDYFEEAEEELEFQHPNKLECIKLELKTLISELESQHVVSKSSSSSMPPFPCAATQEPSSIRKTKRSCPVVEASNAKVESCVKRRCNKTDAVLERAQLCLHKIQHLKTTFFVDSAT